MLWIRGAQESLGNTVMSGALFVLSIGIFRGGAKCEDRGIELKVNY